MTDISFIKKIAVVGAGTMGREIAQVALMAGFEKVFLYSRSIETITKAKNFIENGLNKLKSKGILDEGVSPELLMENLVLNRDIEKTVENADFVIESVPENMELKQEVFKKLGKFAPKHAILATNTSTMSITKIAETSGRADKVIGMHFFTPIVVLRLIEVIKGAKTSKETFNISIAIGEKFPALKGKRYIAKIEKESPGFIVNRLTISTSLYQNWLLDMAMEKGIPIETIDNDVIAYPGIGPFAKWDYFGIDVICDTRNYFAKELSPDFAPGKTLKTLLKEGKLGKKTGKGLYEWKEGKHIITNNEKANIFNSELFYAIQLNEGCRLLEEGIVSGYKVIDDTMLAGMDMPGPFGPGKNNYQKWTKLLEDFVKKSGINYLKPSDLMKSGGFINMRK
ncbi:MAG: 3-hydroxyacyl-CoA dehydrogenase NAD-binding domain-containing protein [Candidatus Hodarchaeota archaeon]